tara:strand:+ start:288 stop:617 length:330 start_codon:yes stop_codon:yes gene_type:complete
MKNLSIFLLFLLYSCTYNELPISEIAICETNSPSFSDCVLPIIENNCVSCHSENGGQYPFLTSFPEIISAVENDDLLARIKNDMPPGNLMNSSDILIIENWIDENNQNN